MSKFLPIDIQDFEKMISGDFVYVDIGRRDGMKLTRVNV